jgi:hypothetical protein
VRETWNVFDFRYLYKASHDTWIHGKKLEHWWKPSIHMPKAAARIFLKVTKVRVERVQNITEDEAIKEGFSHGGIQEVWIKAIDSFISTWNKIYENWDDNPWVWVIEFERMM